MIKISPRSQSEFRRALQLYALATKKDEAEILNRAGKNVAFRSAQFTPRANAGAIAAKLSANRNRLAILILAKRGRFQGLTFKERERVVRRFISARRRSAGYIRAGWGPAIAAFGGRATKLNPKSEAAKGYGIKATARNLIAQLANNARGAGIVGEGALRKALDFVARDMISYANRKLAQTGRKHSAR